MDLDLHSTFIRPLLHIQAHDPFTDSNNIYYKFVVAYFIHETVADGSELDFINVLKTS